MGKMQKTKRLFVAVNLPEETKKEIAKTMERIPKEKWGKVKQENIHITLAFLGWVPEQATRKTMQAMEKLSGFEEFEIELEGFGHFDGRVLWIGIGKGTEELSILSRKLNAALGTKDERFHSHITLARNKAAKREEVMQLVEKLGQTNLRKTIMVKSIELMESKPQKTGPVYEKIFSVTLQDRNP